MTPALAVSLPMPSSRDQEFAQGQDTWRVRGHLTGNEVLTREPWNIPTRIGHCGTSSFPWLCRSNFLCRCLVFACENCAKGWRSGMALLGLVLGTAGPPLSASIVVSSGGPPFWRKGSLKFDPNILCLFDLRIVRDFGGGAGVVGASSRIMSPVKTSRAA